jgi:5-methylcytosine-specific restriction enzyme A
VYGPGCHRLGDTPGRCAECKRHYERGRRRRRGKTAARGYDAKWRQLVELAIRAHPYCVDCRHPGSADNPLSGDHIIPRADGGPNMLDNIAVRCRVCNGRRGATVRRPKSRLFRGASRHPKLSHLGEKRTKVAVKTGRPPTPLLELVQERRFDGKNKRHRAKLARDDSLLEYVAENPDASARMRMLAETQERYRRTGAVSTTTVWEARQFEAGVRRLGEDGEPLLLVL